MNKNRATVILLAVAFLVSFIFINWFLSSRDIDHIPSSHIWIPAYVMGGITLACTILIPTKPLMVAPMGIAGVLIGVAFDALTDRKMDRNLFPIEMIIWAGISTPGIFTGNILGCLVFWTRKKLHNHQIQPK